MQTHCRAYADREVPRGDSEPRRPDARRLHNAPPWGWSLDLARRVSADSRRSRHACDAGGATRRRTPRHRMHKDVPPRDQAPRHVDFTGTGDVAGCPASGHCARARRSLRRSMGLTVPVEPSIAGAEFRGSVILGPGPRRGDETADRICHKRVGNNGRKNGPPHALVGHATSASGRAGQTSWDSPRHVHGSWRARSQPGDNM